MRASTLLAAVLALAAGAAPAADEHYEAARAFHEATRVDDPKAVGALVTRLLTELQPGLRAHEAIIADFAREVIDSPEYEQAKIKTYMELFSEYELRRLTALFRDETYRKYRSVSVELARRTAQHTMQLFQSKLPELERRIRENAARQQNQSTGANR